MLTCGVPFSILFVKFVYEGEAKLFVPKHVHEKVYCGAAEVQHPNNDSEISIEFQY